MPQRQAFYCEGALTRDAELRYTPSGSAVLAFRIGTGHTWGYNKEEGTKNEDRAFIDCSMFGKMAEHLKDRMVKGCIVNLDGHFKTEEWEDKKSGKMTSRLRLYVHNLSVVEIRPRRADPEEDERRPQSREEPAEEPQEDHERESDELPF